MKSTPANTISMDQVCGPSLLCYGSPSYKQCAIRHTMPDPSCLRCILLSYNHTPLTIPSEEECTNTVRDCIVLCTSPIPPDLDQMSHLAKRMRNVAHYKEHCAFISQHELDCLDRANYLLEAAIEYLCSVYVNNNTFGLVH